MKTKTIRIKSTVQEALDNISFLPAEEYGCGEIEPKVVEVNKYYRFKITYTVGEKEITEGGGISVRIPWRGWSFPCSNPRKEGYVEVDTDGNTNFKIEFVEKPSDAKHWIIIKVIEGVLHKGEHIFIYYGSKDNNGPGALVQNFSMKDVIFYMTYGVNPVPLYADDVTSPEFPGYIIEKRLAKEPKVNVIAGKADNVLAVMPTLARRNETVKFKLILMDKYQNPASKVNSNKELIISDISWDNNEDLLSKNNKKILLDKKSPFKKEIKVRTPKKNGTYYLLFNWNNKKYRSNPVIVENNSKNHIYWGEIHAQGALSDGLGFPSEYYEKSKNIYFMDIGTMTDHSDGLCFPIVVSTHKYQENKWDITCQASKKFNKKGEFVTLPGAELSSDIKKYPSGKRERNHRNLYFYEENNSVCFNWREFPETEDWYRLCKGLKYMIIPHTHRMRLDCRKHNPSTERVIEIKSDKGSGEYFNHIESPTKDHGGVLEFLKRGYRVGIVGGGDYHHNTPGRHYPLREKKCYVGAETEMGGYAAIIAPELSRKSVWSAIYNRNTYATTGIRIFLDFKLLYNKKIVPMSREKVIKINENKKRIFKIKYALTTPLKKIELIRNGKINSPVDVYKNNKKELYCGEIILEDNENVKKLWQDAYSPPMLPHKFIYYFVKIFQQDGEIAWSSPIWFSNREILSKLNK